MAMFSSEDLARREKRQVELDESGASEAYFPLWGVSNVEEYLQKSDELRLDLACAEGSCVDEVGEGVGEDALPAALLCSSPSNGTGDVVSGGARVAWGAWFWLRRVVFALVVCVVGSLLVTMALNPSMTFFEAAEALLGGLFNLLGGGWL